jgi:hypothetical protein
MDQSWTVKDNFTNNKEQEPEMKSLTLIKAYLVVFPGYVNSERDLMPASFTRI